MPWNWSKLRRAFGESPPPPPPPQNDRQQQQQFSATSKTNTSADSVAVRSLAEGRRICASSAAPSTAGCDRSDDGYHNTNTRVQRGTPVLFCTNRGLHLRVARPVADATLAASTSAAARVSSNSRRTHTANAYEIRFCDLERWSTNRANTVSLEDTFTVTPRNASISHMETIDSSGHSGASQHTGTSFFVPLGRRSMCMARSNSNANRSCSIKDTFSRFGME